MSRVKGVASSNRSSRARKKNDRTYSSQAWVVSLSGKPEPHPVTVESVDETYDLRWLDDHKLVFDRVADVVFYKQSRIWKVDVPR